MRNFKIFFVVSVFMVLLNSEITGQQYNTFYGINAGGSNTTGNRNAFFGAYAGYSNTTGYYNTFVGERAGYYNTSGKENTFLGRYTGYHNTTGSYNSFLGDAAGTYNTTGSYNMFSGFTAGYKNTTGSYNTFSGHSSGYHNTTGKNNLFSGYAAGFNNTTGSYNVFSGYAAGYHNTTGHNNTFFGYAAGNKNTTGNNNTFVGNGSGFKNTTGKDNTFSGFNAGYHNTTGDYNSFSGLYAGFKNTSGSSNTFTGHTAGMNNTTGSYNTFSGYQSGYKNTTAGYNTFVGWQAGYNTTTGNYNTFLGYGAGKKNIMGHSNTFLGLDAGYYSTGSGNVFIGHHSGANEMGSNKLYIANDNTSTPLIYGDFASEILDFNGDVKIGNLSDRHYLNIASKIWPEVRFQTPLSDREIRLGVAHANTAYYGVGEGDFYVYAKRSGTMPLIINQEGDIYLSNKQGNVGIGTTAPDAKLTIKGNGSTVGSAAINFKHAGYGMSIGLGTSGNNLHIGNSWNPESGTYLTIVDGTGNVGIGTKAPGNYKLAVEGKLGAREIEVKTSSWADFVFDESYVLKPLAEVENFVKTNKHLPDVPSEKEVLAEGINLGAMDVVLLQKIEELTLYTIKQQKEIEMLKSQVSISGK